jgi:hypothetical protein
MTNEPAPETDAKLADDPHPPSDWPAYARALEIQRNAARAERDALTAENERLATGNHSMEKEIPELRHALEKARCALEGIVEYGKLCNLGTATDCARLIYLANQALTTPAQ